MKKRFFYNIFIILCLFCFFSCKKDNNSSMILGSYTLENYIKNELTDDSEDPQIFAICNTTSSTEITFNEDKTYSLEVTQTVDEIKFLFEYPYVTEELIDDYFNQNIVIKGKYTLKDNSLTLVNETIIKDDAEYEFEEYQENDPSVGQKTQTVEFILDNESITLISDDEMITYFREQ